MTRYEFLLGQIPPPIKPLPDMAWWASKIYMGLGFKWKNPVNTFSDLEKLKAENEDVRYIHSDDAVAVYLNGKWSLRESI